MVFKSNPGFIFHDSRGFEAGGDTELENVKAFITERSKNLRLQDQVHAIWYVIYLELYIPSFSSVAGTASRWMTVGLLQRPKSTFSLSVVLAVVSSRNYIFNVIT
jgi:hypothetical protein